MDRTDRSFNCLLVNVNANTRTVKTIPIFQNSLDGRKYVRLNDQISITYLNRFTVALLKDLICEMYKIKEFYDMKLWKVNVNGDDIKNKKISTDIVKLGGKEMKFHELFEVFFEMNLIVTILWRIRSNRLHHRS
jgi:hypothetical protein